MEFVVVLSVFLIRVERTVERFISPDHLGNIWFLRERDGALPRNSFIPYSAADPV